ncbi:glutamate--cysteine ligase [Arhodomonas sp. AD133]|uniref:glutamate--cysteine ligase n=1 Tax=Arhodomonas sp. AD133 TaxID=3415009 RepID=UPI003EB6C715
MSVTPLEAVPHLTTALNGPLQQLESVLLERRSHIERWLREQWRLTPAPFYASVDLRNAGFKLAPVDTNLFPAGFNNLAPEFEPLCVQAIQSAMERFCPDACSVLIVPENHTRNGFYLQSVATLEALFRRAGYDVRVGSLIDELDGPTRVATADGDEVVLEPLVRSGNRVGVADFDPCLVVLNNDLSGGRPAILEGLEQPVMPPLELGWSNRRKSDHFDQYRQVAEEFCEFVGIDPWLITPLHRDCGEVDFRNRGNGDDCLTHNVEQLLDEIRERYRAHGVDREPFVVIKADAGTYGMGVMTAHSGEEVRQLNRKQRNRMSAVKEGLAVSRLLIQEGVHTSETWGPGDSSAEPVVYMIDHFVVGGFYRVHHGKGHDENLNAPGMTFESLAFAKSCNCPDERRAPDASVNRFYAYGVIARLALLAAARELAAVEDPA